MRAVVLALIAVSPASAQWTLQQSHTTASLRGVYNAGGGVVWASGTQGTVLHSTDDGQTWQPCVVPEGAEKLDFRGVQAFDAKVAMVMSSGVGGLSRLYKTSDACRTWRLVFRDPDEGGFWDAMRFTGPALGTLIGDQVDGHFPVFFSIDAGETWQRFDRRGLAASDKKQSFFAASNTSLWMDSKNSRFYMITGGGTTALITVGLQFAAGVICGDCLKVSTTQLALAVGETAGGFSLAGRVDGSEVAMVAVGGNYKAPEQPLGTAAYSKGGRLWHASETLPGGYRSAVAYNAAARSWITVGPNGTDLSTDDGRNWRALKPSAEETADADKNWNALALPFAVGPNGRIGKFNPARR